MAGGRPPKRGQIDGSSLVPLLRGKGAPKLKGKGHGDMIITVRVSVPEKLDKKQKELIEELEELEPKDLRSFLK